jgi:hypothetical protein
MAAPVVEGSRCVSCQKEAEEREADQHGMEAGLYNWPWPGAQGAGGITGGRVAEGAGGAGTGDGVGVFFFGETQVCFGVLSR